MTTLIDRRQSSGLDPSALGAGRYATLPQQQRGRGAPLNMPGRYEKHGTALFDDGWQTLEDLLDWHATDTPAVHTAYRRAMELEYGFFDANL